MAYGSNLQKKIYFNLPYVGKCLISTAYGWLQKKERNSEAYKKYFNHLEEIQWYSNKKLEPIQGNLLKEFLIHARSKSAFWAEVFTDHHFEPNRVESLKDLHSLPILSKETLRQNLPRIISANDSAQLHWVNTSGTTGLGLSFPETRDCYEREYAYRFHNYHCSGVEFGDRWAFCAGHPVADPERTSPPFWVEDHASNWLLMSSYHLAEANLESYIRKLESFKPTLIGGYPSSVYMLALANQHFGGKVRPKSIYTASETLFDHQRAAIEESFGCKSYTYYGNAERCGFIGECLHGRLHSRLEHTAIEVLDSDGKPVEPGKSGRLICTGFGNFATPLIRYDVGDIATLAESQICPCGRGGLLFSEIVGRTEDYIITPDGRFVGRLDHLFKDAHAVRMGQLVQESVEEIIIRIVKEPTYSEMQEQEILKEARIRLGPAIKIKFEYVAAISRTKNGKFPFIVSKLSKKSAFGKDLSIKQSHVVASNN